MVETNKTRAISALKVLALFLLAFLAIITNSEIWNCAVKGGTDGFHVWVAIFNFLFEGAAVYGVYRLLFKKSTEEKK